MILSVWHENTQVYKYTIEHKYTIRHKYSLGQIVAKSYALHVKLHLASKPNALIYCIYIDHKSVSDALVPSTLQKYNIYGVWMNRKEGNASGVSEFHWYWG